MDGNLVDRHISALAWEKVVVVVVMKLSNNDGINGVEERNESKYSR